jgi:RNA polymerase-binding transcription factor DksA
MTAGAQVRNAGLSPKQLARLRASLERLRDALRARVIREAEQAREAERLVEPLEAAEQTREQDDAVALLEHDREQLRAVERALARMDDGHYGISAISGKPIPYERLLAVPWTDRDSNEEQPSSQTT